MLKLLKQLSGHRAFYPVVIVLILFFTLMRLVHINADAPHPAAARLWQEYLYSDEGQLGWLKGYCHPIRFNDLAKNGKIRDDGRMVHDMYLFEVKTQSESKYPWDYYKILATVPAEKAFRKLSESTCPLSKK